MNPHTYHIIKWSLRSNCKSHTHDVNYNTLLALINNCENMLYLNTIHL